MSRVLRALCLALLAASLLGAPALAQQVPAVGELPSGEGILSGRVLDPGGRAAADISVSLIAFQQSGEQGLRRTKSAEDGSFRFEALSTAADIIYFVVAETDGVHHSERTAFAPGATSASVDVRIARRTAETWRARRGDADVRFERSCSGLRVTETHALTNRTRSVIFVPEAERANAQPLLDLELPAGAGELANPFGTRPAGLERDGRSLRFWGPLYPGEQKLEFAYPLIAEGDTLEASWGYPTGTRRLTFLADPTVPDAAIEGLREREPREVFERSHRSFSERSRRPGAQVALSVTFTEAPPLATLREAQLWIELDDAALAIDERIALEPSAEATAASLLCIALPPDADDIRFSQSALALSIARDVSGMLEVRGPLPPGEQLVSLRYTLPVPGDSVDFERNFGVRVPLLGVLVSDTGVLPETKRLHRRRPVRRVDRNYLHLEGFEVAADENVQIRFTRLEAPRSLPQSATIGFAALVAGGLLFYLGGPLRRPDTEADSEESAADQLAAERENVYAAIRDLDEDFATGKLTEADYTQLRSELRERAVRLLEAERQAGAPEAANLPTPPPTAGETPSPLGPQLPAAQPQIDPARPSLARPNLARPYVPNTASTKWRFCPACGGELPKQPQFCPHCGERMPSTDPGA